MSTPNEVARVCSPGEVDYTGAGWGWSSATTAMTTVAPSIRRRPRSRSEARAPNSSHHFHQPSSAHTPSAVPVRSPRSFSRNLPCKITIDTHPGRPQPSPRRGAGSLALKARDSVAVRKRTMSNGAMSARAARQSARKANAAAKLEPEEAQVASPSGAVRGRTRSRSPAGTPSTRTDSHRKRLRSPSPSSSSPSQSPTPVTPGFPALSGAPSSFHGRPRTHVPHNSQGTTTSAYPPSSSHSSRSSSPSLERSRTPSPLPTPQKPFQSSAPHSPSLDLDPDDVNARLRLLVNNSYFLPPAHAKPELPPIYLSPNTIKGASSPNAFREFFRVGKKKEKKAPPQLKGLPIHPAHVGPPRSMSSGHDGRYGSLRHGDGYFDLQPQIPPPRNRVVVVRETVDILPPPAVRAPIRTSSLPINNRPRTAPEKIFIDPTTQYDMPPPSRFPSYALLQLDTAGIRGNVELDQFAPPGSPWSPAPTSPRSLRGTSGSGMDTQERVWRRALLEQAVDLSLSSAASDPGHVSPSPAPADESVLRGLKLDAHDSEEPVSPSGPRGKKSWWARKDKDMEALRRPSTSSSNKERDIPRSPGPERATHSLDGQIQPLPSPLESNSPLRPALGQCIIPNMHAEMEELEREQARLDEQRVQQTNTGRPPLRLSPLLPFGSSVSAPATPVYHTELSSTPPLPMTPLRPRPAYRKSEPKRDAFGDGTRGLMPGHSTIRKSLSSPLLSDLHEMGVDVEGPIPLPSESNDSLNGVGAPSLVLQDPHGVTSLVASNTSDSFTSGSHYSDDEQEMFDAMMTPHEQHFGFEDVDVASLEQWSRSLSSPDHGDGRPSFDSFRVRGSEAECPPRASSTFGFRRSTVSVSNPSLLRSHQDIEVDISGDPIEHLSMMGSGRSTSPGGESHISSIRGYVSALDLPA
ncbi:hypothetical protein K439DRAFT_1063713 [Ramaria rubella]|nr:hypothetical protein K439DRAFT_1063713 [Ramaria rubella]